MLGPLCYESNHTLYSTKYLTCRERRVIFNTISIVTTCLSASEFTVSHSKLSQTSSNQLIPQHIWMHLFHSFPVMEEVKIFQVCILPTRRKHLLSIWEHCTLPDKILPVQQIRWTANTGRKRSAGKEGLLFPCVDLNDLTAITPKQTLGDNNCSFGQAYRLTARFPEKTFAAHGMSLLCRWGGGACECTVMSEEQADFYVIKKILLLVKGEYTVSLLIWPWVLLLWLFIGPWLRFCAEETPAEPWLPADRPDSWTHGWMAAHPIKPTGAHMLRKGVKAVCVCNCDCVSTNCLCVSLGTFLMWACECVYVCVRRGHIDW